MTNMRITTGTVEAWKAAIEPLDTEEARAAYRAGNFPRADRVKDLNKRYRWDLAHAAKLNLIALYDVGCNDTHIDTALRNIVPAL
jgi:hypothetical protein